MKKKKKMTKNLFSSSPSPPKATTVRIALMACSAIAPASAYAVCSFEVSEAMTLPVNAPASTISGHTANITNASFHPTTKATIKPPTNVVAA